MASKKYKLLLGILTLMATSTFAQQSGSGYSVFDSSVIPSKRLPQQNEFWNNSYNFPAKPRNMWEVGVSTGVFNVSGDVPTRFFTAPNFGVHVRKAFGYVFSMRLQYINAVGKGLHWLPTQSYVGHPGGWNAPGGDVNSPYTGVVFHNYKTNVQDLSLQGLVTLNNVRFHKNKTGITFYGGGGIGATIYKTKINALDAEGNNYQALFNNVNGLDLAYQNRKDILSALKDGMDDSYETDAENQGDRRPKIGENTLKPTGTVIVGIAYKLSKRVNLALEDRHTFTKDDLLDGQRWQESGTALTRDFDSYNYLSLGLNVNLGGKAVEPLWWLNPLDYAYSELNNPKHMKLPKPILDDSDGDGVTDQLDREPNTPAGCPVDTHGVTKDTDGDGVPDCKDKQLITPTECQPVDADGVGKCPEPECCKNIGKGMIGPDGQPISDACAAVEYPSLSFKGKSLGLSGDAKALLASVASKLKDSPDCSVIITGYPGASKAQQSLADKRLDAVKKYLVETLGISADRIATDKKIGEGDENTVDIKSN